ncbi:TPA: hypothetical protein HA297_05865 [Candidatus Woesearchaeota archaeon]|nr:hypothetical protein [Candidatus Woesearchaeota archaeon]
MVQAESLLVETTLLNTPIHPDSWVYVRAGNTSITPRSISKRTGGRDTILYAN